MRREEEWAFCRTRDYEDETSRIICFFGCSVLLLFVFWLGNDYVPDLIFKDSVFRKEPEGSLDPTGTTSGDKSLTEQSEVPERIE